MYIDYRTSRQTETFIGKKSNTKLIGAVIEVTRQNQNMNLTDFQNSQDNYADKTTDNTR